MVCNADILLLDMDSYLTLVQVCSCLWLCLIAGGSHLCQAVLGSVNMILNGAVKGELCLVPFLIKLIELLV